MCGCKMAQPTLDAITNHGVSERSTDNKSNVRPGRRHAMPLGPNMVRYPHGMDAQGWPTYSNATPRRPPEVLRVAHSQQSRQHRSGSDTDVKPTGGCGPCGAGRK